MKSKTKQIRDKMIREWFNLFIMIKQVV
jgi:hypothetical protein